MVQLLTEKFRKHLKGLKETLPQDQINADSKILKTRQRKKFLQYSTNGGVVIFQRKQLSVEPSYHQNR